MFFTTEPHQRLSKNSELARQQDGTGELAASSNKKNSYLTLLETIRVAPYPLSRGQDQP